MELFDFLQVDEKAYPDFSEELKHSMQREPIEFFQYVLNEDRSVMDFLHAYYSNQLRYAKKHLGAFAGAAVRASIAAGMIGRMIGRPRHARAYAKALCGVLKRNV
jgi:hypothetical protein